MKFTVLTLFPEQVRSFLETSITGRALTKGLFSLETVQIRDYCANSYGKVDDTMFGGGTGMLMTCEPVYRAWKSVLDQAQELQGTFVLNAIDQKSIAQESFEQNAFNRMHTVFLSPKGSVFNQKKAIELSKYHHLVLLCGHYEGIDQRVLDEIVDEEISIGDYVLTGGEIAACTVIDAAARMIPGVLPDVSAYEEESHMPDLLEAPQYTRPEIWHEKAVPPILLSGHHLKIREWKRIASLYDTWQKRPDLMNCRSISKDDWKDLLERKDKEEEKNARKEG